MRRARVTRFAAPAALVALLAISLPAGAARSQQHILFPSSCNNERYRPSSIMIACGDATLKARDLRWRTWTDQEARGRGIARYNDCRPNCANGQHHTLPATVKLTRPRSWSSAMAWGHRFSAAVSATMSGC